jgi:hypothetical protein
VEGLFARQPDGTWRYGRDSGRKVDHSRE